jgi:hypothetical protein
MINNYSASSKTDVFTAIFGGVGAKKFQYTGIKKIAD